MFFKKRKQNIVRVVDFCYDLSKKERLNPIYRRYWKRLARIIEEYEAERKEIIYSNFFTEDTVNDFIRFIKSKKPEKKNHNAYRLSTVKTFYCKLLVALNKIKKQGYDVSTDFNIRFKKEDGGAVYLTVDEIKKINELRLAKEQAQVRDIFLVGCCTALRYSDYSRLTEDNFIGNNIEIVTKKTDTKVVIPIHYIVKEIIERNKGYGFLYYKNSQQNFNRVIKNICRSAKINDKVLVERTEGFRTLKKLYKKYELVSTHTARRSGATNMYLSGILPFRIMLITGHKTESSFYKYIRIQKELNAKELFDSPFFRGN